jgi:riboflavin synthase
VHDSRVFTGIITAQGTVVELDGPSLWLRAPELCEEADGASIAVDGCCLTIAGRREDQLRFDLLPNTLERTTLGQLVAGDNVNLEPALAVGDRMGGHWVQGHVDGVGTVLDRNEADALRLTIELPSDIARLSVERGSITLNGVSLTVMTLEEQRIDVQLVSETRTRTNLGALRVGDQVNVEGDVLARYVQRLLAAHAIPPAHS